ncbi:MAG TPA: enoyl-CoA hydratase/isomerase family protein [Methylovirgula sp.]|nr:enoyl-CoA hydratase/isomerase family protein [Methylovirgula sp.]
MSEAEIGCEKIGHCGVITLDRPRVLNALSSAMVTGMARALDAFAKDEAIGCVVVRSTSAAAFCAGADIKRVAELGIEGKHAEQLAFLRTEYQNCHRIKFYPKPYVALIDGIVMGGGAGIGVNGAYRVVGERVTFAMPEVGIGFFPDVGSSYFLSRLPARIGTYLAVTGVRVALGDVVALGLANAHVPAERFDALFERLVTGEAVERAIAAEASTPPASELLQNRDLIARCFGAPNLAGIFAALEDTDAPFAQSALALMKTRSPTSMALALRQMQIGPALGFAEALRMEYRIANRIVHGHDFYEGVRAVLVAKDHAPNWQPPSIREVTEAEIGAYFAPQAEELVLTEGAA